MKHKGDHDLDTSCNICMEIRRDKAYKEGYEAGRKQEREEWEGLFGLKSAHKKEAEK